MCVYGASKNSTCVSHVSMQEDVKDEESTFFFRSSQSAHPEADDRPHLSRFRRSLKAKQKAHPKADDFTGAFQFARQECFKGSSWIEALSRQSAYKAYINQTFEPLPYLGHPLDDPLGLEFSTLTDLLALSAVATHSFYFVQPVSRYRLSRNTNRRSVRASNVDIVCVGRSALYKCGHCSAKHLALTPALSCTCFLS